MLENKYRFISIKKHYNLKTIFSREGGVQYHGTLDHFSKYANIGKIMT